MQTGFVFLIPTYLSESNKADFLAPIVLETIKNTTYYLVENVRTARRFISSLNLGIAIDTLQFEVVDKRAHPELVDRLLAPVKKGRNAGVISEAGLPGIADPGNLIVSWAHQHHVRVVPLPGATSIQTALVTSGFNGQQFTFHGYLPIQKKERIKKIREMEASFQKTGYTQLFMETPFRNMALLDDLLRTLNSSTHLHIATDLFGAAELSKTMSVDEWKQGVPDLHKLPTVYCIGHLSSNMN